MIRLLTVLLIISIQGGYAADTTKVLFIGNSITYFNDMPETFQEIANAQGDITSVTVYAPGGTGFVNHVDNPIVFEKFREDNWDYVVLQPGSNESPGYSFTIEETLERGRVLVDSIHANNPCAQVVFYEISYGVWGATAENLVTYNETMDAIRSNLTILADSTRSFFAPAGEAIRTEWNADQSNLLWGGTGDIHPNTKGSYIIACSFYASIFQKTSFGADYYATLTEEQALGYQKLADTTVLNHLPDWRINVYNPHTDYIYSLSNDTLYFESILINIDSVNWIFGDGGFTNEESGEHFYDDEGAYSVSLVSFSNGCTDTLTFNIEMTAVSVRESSIASVFKVYPNPAMDHIRIDTPDQDKQFLFEIYNTQGSLVLRSGKTELDISKFSNGIYYLRILDENHEVVDRVKWLKM